MAAIALSRGLNSNLVHQWVRAAKGERSLPVATNPAKAREFIELPLPTTLPAPRDIRIEVRRGATTVIVSWPVDAADRCAACLRELLR